ncbi:Rad1-domain-containing protein, partial [Rhizodiscina lignyota]
PLFSAVSSSARQLHSLLKCIAFTNKVQVQISQDGLRFSTGESSVMEGHAFLDKKLFTAFKYQQPEEDNALTPIFEINLPALLETLQIFGASDTSTSSSSRFHSYNKPAISAFSASTLGLTSLCTLTYDNNGEPLTIMISEGNVETKCELTTYEPNQMEDIPFARDRLATKVIMRSEWLADAIAELAATNPERLTIEAGPGKVGFRLRASGPLGSAEIEFDEMTAKRESGAASFSHPNPSAAVPQATGASGVLETFQASIRSVNSYKFSMIRAATLAMKQAVKVSVRVDDQGVLSLQFMIEVEGGSGAEQHMSFVDFRFVPLVGDEDGEEQQNEEGGGGD